MRDIQEFGVEKQKIPTPVVPISEGGLGLGNSAIQFFSGYRLPAPQQSKPVSKLEALKRMRFSVVGRAERIARSLEALNQVESLKLTPEEWHFFAEDVDLEDKIEILVHPLLPDSFVDGSVVGGRVAFFGDGVFSFVGSIHAFGRRPAVLGSLLCWAISAEVRLMETGTIPEHPTTRHFKVS